ncbi:hypothetical protein GCM10008101_26650 [Lysobacter xinjiangensis]|uniref:Dolichyl-phosphate-mannose-protein mannosyltransferase n=1 Tax=Cognatilysobacter xinjiangensis TaxID=546892 RepID=A0ABQ3C6N3_9GAMM|nr:hypothetical protein GCM10008101_26650 [Lysobacter xinjiangensis]
MLEGPLTFDGQYYMDIFERGYSFDGDIENKQNTAFMPLTAGVIGLATRVIPGAHDLVEVAVLGAAVLFGTLVGLHVLASRYAGSQAGRLATLLWAGSPLALYNFVGYSEPLFALLSVWIFIAIDSKRLWDATLLAAIALVGRPQAFVLAVFVALAILSHARWRPRSLFDGPGVVQLCLMVAPLMTFATWQAIQFGDSLTYINSLEAWRRGSFMDANLTAGPALLHLFQAVSGEAQTLSHWTTLLATLSLVVIAAVLMVAAAGPTRVVAFYVAILTFLFATASFDATNVARHTFFMFPWALILGVAIAKVCASEARKLIGLVPFLAFAILVNSYAVMRYYRGEWVS